MAKTLLQKVWDLHTVRVLPTGQTQLFIGLHLVHEVTSPQAFDALRERGWKVARTDRTFATVDHIIPTRERQRPFLDVMAEDMISALERNCRDFGIPLYDIGDERQGIVHVIGPELGLTQPGMTIACGDSHTSTHGAFGALAHGIVEAAQKVREGGSLARSLEQVPRFPELAVEMIAVGESPGSLPRLVGADVPISGDLVRKRMVFAPTHALDVDPLGTGIAGADVLVFRHYAGDDKPESSSVNTKSTISGIYFRKK